MLWIKELLKELAKAGVMLGKKSDDDEFISSFQKANNITTPLNPCTVRVDNDISKECSPARECKLLEAATHKKIAIYDFEIGDKGALRQAAEHFISPSLSVKFWSDKEIKDAYCCSKCFFKYKLLSFINRLDYAALKVSLRLDFSTEPKTVTLVGQKIKEIEPKKEEKKEEKTGKKEEKKTEETATDKKMIVFGIKTYNGSYLLNIKNPNEIGLLLINEYTHECGIESKRVWKINDEVKDVAKIISNNDYTVEYFDVYSIYIADKNNKITDMLSDNYAAFRNEYVRSCPDDSVFADIRAIVPINKRGERVKADQKKKKEEASKKAAGIKEGDSDTNRTTMIAICGVAVAILIVSVSIIRLYNTDEMDGFKKVPEL